MKKRKSVSRQCRVVLRVIIARRCMIEVRGVLASWTLEQAWMHVLVSFVPVSFYPTRWNTFSFHPPFITHNTLLYWHALAGPPFSKQLYADFHLGLLIGFINWRSKVSISGRFKIKEREKATLSWSTLGFSNLFNALWKLDFQKSPRSCLFMTRVILYPENHEVDL